MKYEIEMFPYVIRTIPDDMIFFSLFNLNDSITKKFIMENYINFYSFKVLEENYVSLRFEDFMKEGNFEGIDHCFISIDIMKDYNYDLKIIKELLRAGYLITLPIATKYISFYKFDGGHLITVYGVDTEKDVFLCKDFQEHEFVEFEVSVKDMQNGLLNYHRMNRKESEGLLALRLSNSCNTKIDYSKVFLEFWKLQQDFCTDTMGFGIGALNLLTTDIEERYNDFFKADEWYNPANYLRESSKLMNIRYDILQEEVGRDKTVDGRQMLIKLEKDTRKLFFNVEKKIYKGKELTKEEFEKFYYLFLECKEDFRKTAEIFCDKIEKYLK
ncbi:MAG: hypothetical protein ACLTBS_08220 [Eisenbergiella sp.]